MLKVKPVKLYSFETVVSYTTSYKQKVANYIKDTKGNVL